MTEHDTYKTAQHVFGRISTELTDLPEKMLCEALDQLETWWGNLRQRSIAMPPVPAGNDTEDEANDSQVPSTQLTEYASGSAEKENDAVVQTASLASSSQKTPVATRKPPNKSTKTTSSAATEATKRDALKPSPKLALSEFNKRASRLGRPQK
ncbi:unnamed protein product [Phytophthora fragariaefolia]|uniref:Unnamed protein product n=1 Tax=Phytophthora fragariaefolia TaxID=1490495 RepID=A0A9W6U155_9STRA|nr:unnamed protein product [Phytophthora fragariaefolia]